jgi:hypothetical protein
MLYTLSELLEKQPIRFPPTLLSVFQQQGQQRQQGQQGDQRCPINKFVNGFTLKKTLRTVVQPASSRQETSQIDPYSTPQTAVAIAPLVWGYVEFSLFEAGSQS